MEMPSSQNGKQLVDLLCWSIRLTVSNLTYCRHEYRTSQKGHSVLVVAVVAYAFREAAKLLGGP
jgi:hypothetical protein